MITTIEEAKKFLNDNFEEGTECPCCNQNVKLHPFKLTGGVASILIKFYKARDKGWVHPIKEFNTINGNYAKLRHWGLIEKNKNNSDPSVKASGLWRITIAGISFVDGDCLVPEKVKLFNNKFYGYSGGQITIRQALGNKFNYEQLMNN
tara:strand:- start:109 stop:555 length:447 start_codon:yes stop_codon:yes gene_type:complete